MPQGPFPVRWTENAVHKVLSLLRSNTLGQFLALCLPNGFSLFPPLCRQNWNALLVPDPQHSTSVRVCVPLTKAWPCVFTPCQYHYCIALAWIRPHLAFLSRFAPWKSNRACLQPAIAGSLIRPSTALLLQPLWECWSDAACRLLNHWFGLESSRNLIILFMHLSVFKVPWLICLLTSVFKMHSELY